MSISNVALNFHSLTKTVALKAKNSGGLARVECVVVVLLSHYHRSEMFYRPFLFEIVSSAFSSLS